MKKRYPDAWACKAVLEVGSRSINGTPRSLFNAPLYFGVDSAQGPGVDAVAILHLFEPLKHNCPAQFDFIVSTSTLEHDPYYEKTLRSMCLLLSDNGSMAITWAGPGFPAHNVDDSPEPGFYNGNLSIKDVTREVERLNKFEAIYHEFNETTGDAFLFCHRKNPKEEKR